VKLVAPTLVTLLFIVVPPTSADIVLEHGPGGMASLVNTSLTRPVLLTSYSITRSDSGAALVPVDWDSYGSQGLAFTVTSATADQLAESVDNDGLWFDPGEKKPIGGPFLLRADANGDARVDLSDFGQWKQNQGLFLSGPGFGDFDYDGVVDSDDFDFLLSEMGNSAIYTFSATTAVPEPSAMQLIVMLLGLAAIRRRR
jgi:hypothetical protein